MKPRVFSGIQPTGSLHLGSYLGAVRNWVRDQDKFDNIFCIVDLHALTMPQDPAELRRGTRDLAIELLAAGIDPERSLLFLQSQVPEHTTLSWLLGTITPMGWLNRMTQFKSKAGSERETVGSGLFVYPVLQAADILAYHTDFVPVGEDQKQHLELTRDVAARFNHLYGETFTVPEPMIPEVGARIMALDDPSRKMSKSEPAGALMLTDSPEFIRKKISRAVTDSLGDVSFQPERPGLFNLLTMIQSFSGRAQREIEKQFAGQGYKAVKEELTDLIVEALIPFRERYRELEADPHGVDEMLAAGAAAARPMAAKVVREVEEKMGLRKASASDRKGSAAV